MFPVAVGHGSRRPLVKEAGGEVTDFNGGNQYLKTGNIIAGSKGVHQEMLKIIQEIFRN